MSPFLSTAILVFIATITPGPNNLIIMQSAADDSYKHLLINITGIVTGGLLMACMVVASGAALFSLIPLLQTPIVTLGCFYLTYLGINTIVRASYSTQSIKFVSHLPSGAFALACFQFANPKSWVLVSTASVAIGASHQLSSFIALMFILLLIPIVNLLLWYQLGKIIHSTLHTHLSHRLFQQILGGLLIVAAISLFLSFF